MTPQRIVQHFLGILKAPPNTSGSAFAASNIALIKYWGKRNIPLKLPHNSSLSISLDDKGAHTTITLSDDEQDHYIFNGTALAFTDSHYKRFHDFLDLFRVDQCTFKVTFDLNIPVAAGLASSACIFASLVLALNNLFAWQLAPSPLSILARLGSGSAARSIVPGFVEWHRGEQSDGLDSIAEGLDVTWSELRVGLCIVSTAVKRTGSSQGMQHTCDTSPLYARWADTATHDLKKLKQALADKNFKALGEASEANALTMHATMLASRPALVYTLPDTLRLMQRVWALRDDGVAVYFTQDAGPNLKLLFEAQHNTLITEQFKDIDIINPFQQRDVS
ncbi:MAG: diphosphomevalonate decarboxylase [Coxiella sp. (in: Bacteria)]|nr:MAG: diphosphomevalonate decarboxylase [Coxiella sp. (in: g-proteobacteria)]